MSDDDPVLDKISKRVLKSDEPKPMFREVMKKLTEDYEVMKG